MFSTSELFNYHGRLNRMEYIRRCLIYALAAIAMSVFSSFLGTIDYNLGMLMEIIIYAITIPVSVCLAIRRLHDLDRSGWFYLISLVPVVNALLGLYLLFAKGTEGDNQYGPDPLAPKNESNSTQKNY